MFYSHREGSPIWIYPPLDPAIQEWTDEIVREFDVHPVIAQVLSSRGFASIKAINNYLYAKLPDLYKPELFTDMDKAVNRIIHALDTGEGILVYGDNDVDGMTGTALLTDFLQAIGANVHFYVPNRNVPGQSLLLKALEYGMASKCRLLITVDCGITAAQEVQKVSTCGLDVIITDHHEPTGKFSHCIATLNPKLLSNAYPYNELTGVGVAFKLAHAVTNHLTSSHPHIADKIDLKHYLDLVALGTIADMGPLLEENRILVRYGLEELRKAYRVGLAKLFSVCELDLKTLSPADIASKVAPRLNSLGRIADPKKGVELLLLKDPEQAAILAKELDLNNIQRQKIDQLMSEDVEATIKAHPEILDGKAIVMSSSKWHPGIIAIITARIAKLYNRPTVMIAIGHGIGKGSMRTIPEFPLLPMLKENANLLMNFGGHDFAAGLMIEEKNIELFREKFLTKANAILRDNDVVSKLYVDAEAQFNQLTFDFMESLALLAPHGNENPAPILYCDARQVWLPKVIGKFHMKLYLEQGDRLLEGIAFGMADRRDELRKKDLLLRIAYTPQINTFQNKISIQLIIKDFKVLSEEGPAP